MNCTTRRLACCQCCPSCHPARPVSPHWRLLPLTATGLKQSHQSACSGDCCHIVHTRICVSTSLILGQSVFVFVIAYYHYHLTTVTTLYDMTRHGPRLEKCANASEHASYCLFRCFGQLIGPCSRNNFVANLLTVACLPVGQLVLSLHLLSAPLIKVAHSYSS